MSFGRIISRDTVKRQRASRPHRSAGTVHARPETLAESLAKNGGPGIGLLVPTGISTSPFLSEQEYKKYAHLYDPKALGRIARALREPAVRARMSHDNGTAPELHIVGKFLHLGWVVGEGILFQEATLYGFRRRHRVFVSDVALRFNGRFVLCPVDGEYFHDRLQKQRIDDANRNMALGRLGQVLPVPSRYCFEGQTLDDFFAQRLGVTA